MLRLLAARFAMSEYVWGVVDVATLYFRTLLNPDYIDELAASSSSSSTASSSSFTQRPSRIASLHSTPGRSGGGGGGSAGGGGGSAGGAAPRFGSLNGGSSCHTHTDHTLHRSRPLTAPPVSCCFPTATDGTVLVSCCYVVWCCVCSPPLRSGPFVLRRRLWLDGSGSGAAVSSTTVCASVCVWAGGMNGCIEWRVGYRP